METLRIEQIELIILVGAMVAIIARRLKVRTAGLVVAGVGIAFLPLSFNIPFSKELVFDVLLPPLIFEAALYINWKELRKGHARHLTYATLGVILSAVCLRLFMYSSRDGLAGSSLFGVLIAATDPVSIIATFREAKVKGRLRLLVEAESLFNDSTAAVAFIVVLAFAMGEPLGFGSSIWMLFLVGRGRHSLRSTGRRDRIADYRKDRDHLVELS